MAIEDLKKKIADLRHESELFEILFFILQLLVDQGFSLRSITKKIQEADTTNFVYIPAENASQSEWLLFGIRYYENSVGIFMIPGQNGPHVKIVSKTPGERQRKPYIALRFLFNLTQHSCTKAELAQEIYEQRGNAPTLEVANNAVFELSKALDEQNIPLRIHCDGIGLSAVISLETKNL